MKYILKDANVIPMDREVVLEDVDILIGNGRILEISNNIMKEDVKTIDCEGKYVMPGLFDMHVHLNTSDLVDLLYANGITSVRNMWGFPITLQWKKQIKEGRKIGPNIYTTGPLTDGITYWDKSLIVKTPDEADKAVKEVADKGYDYLKTYPDIPREAFIKLMESAKEAGLKVIGHGNKFVTTWELIDLGYYSLEHVSCLPEKENEIIALAKAGVWFCPTQAVCKTIYDFVINAGSSKRFKDIPYYEYVNPIDRREWEEVTEWRKAKPIYQNYTKTLRDENEKAKLYIRNSERILLGTDPPNPGVIAGFSLHDELRFMVEDFGLTPYESIRTGTVNAALCLGIEKEKGMIREGMDADILILDENPLEDIKNSRAINAVIRDGLYSSRIELDKMLDSVKTIKVRDIIKVY